MPIFPITPSSPHHHLAQFDDLAQQTFGICFASWRAAGWWTNDYTVYGLFEADRLLACAGAYRMDLRVRGQNVPAVQIGAVATRSEARGRGFSRQVIEHLLAQVADFPSFLCANESVLDFYPKFGYRKVELRQMEAALPQPAFAKLPVLQPVNQPIRPEWVSRPAFSAIFDCANAAPITAFHLLHEAELHIHTIPALNARIITRQEGSTLYLLDVIVQQPLSFEQLAPYLHFPDASGNPTVQTIRPGFNADWLGINGIWQQPAEDPNLFVRGNWDLPESFILPYLLTT